VGRDWAAAEDADFCPGLHAVTQLKNTPAAATSDIEPTRVALRLVLIYGVFACLWILLSDKAAAWLLDDPAKIILVNVIKGWSLVAVTSLLLFGLIRRQLGNARAASLSALNAQMDKARAKRLLYNIADSSPDVIFAKDLEGRYLLINREAARVIGKSAKQALGCDDTAFFPPEQAEKIRANDLRVITQEQTSTYEETLSTADGDRTYLAIKGPLRNDDGLVIGLFGISRDITERKQAERALQESDNRCRKIVEQSPVSMALVRMDGTIEYINRKAIETFGYTLQDIPDMERWWVCAYPNETYRAKVIAQWTSLVGDALAHNSEIKRREYQVMCKNGNIKVVGIFGVLAAGHVLAIFEDITERKLAEKNLRISAIAFESQEGMFITDADKVILRVNRAFSAITGYSAEEAVGQTPTLLSSGRHDAAFYAEMTDSLRRNGTWKNEVWNRRKNGDVYPEWLTISAVKDDAGEITNYVATLSDISTRKATEDEIKNLEFYDPLTRLPNRRLLLDRLKQTLANTSRIQRKGALLFIDLDNFKTLNDTLGHGKGDLLLQQVAQRLVTGVREGDTVARLGGDEFVVMLEDLSENEQEAAKQAESVGEKILATLTPTFELAGYAHHSTASIGITLFADHRETMEELLKRADLAMYQAKAAGRNTLRFFDPEMQAAVTTRAALEADLRDAILRGHFLLYYQAQVTGKGHLTGVEALIRWQHPLRGIVSPAEFIPVAEDTGLILQIGNWVLETACAQLAIWADRPEMAHLTIAVNVSAHQFRQSDFVAQVLAALDRNSANPHRLKLELTESLLVSNVEDIIAKMTILKARGVGFSLDDFGTGYSSLSYLKRLPLDQLKIDQGFVRDILIDTDDAAIAKMVIALGASMGLAVIAEGVETEAQRDFLARHGCDAYQGYLFSRPLALEAFEAFVTQL